jgi:hypothetical protein
VRVREVAEFRTTLPDGAVEDEAGADFLVWPGRPALEAIGEILVGLGCELEPIECADFKGWDMGFRYRERALWMRVTQIEKHVAYFADPNLWPKLIGRSHRLYLELLDRVGESLGRDPRFSDVQWFAYDAYEPTLSDDPVLAG